MVNAAKQNHSGMPMSVGSVGTTDVCGCSVRQTFTDT